MRDKLLELIKEKESHGGNYNILAYDPPDKNRKLTKMTLKQLVQYQRQKGDRAAGAYQLKPDTIRMLMRNMGLKNTDRFTPQLQEKMAQKLLDYRGYGAYERGEMPAGEFGRNLAQEWASLPVVMSEDYKNPAGGDLRNLVEGMSYYQGEGTNKAKFTPEQYLEYKNFLYGNDMSVPEMLNETPAETQRLGMK